MLQRFEVVGGPLCGHADVPIPLPTPVGGEHRSGLAVPRAEEGQWGALPPLPSSAWHTAPRPPPSPGPTCQVGFGHQGPSNPPWGLGRWQRPPGGCSAVEQAVGLGAGGR